MMRELQEFVERVEKADFRTNEDTGATYNALYVWNKVRVFAGLPRIELKDLPAHCATHQTYHVIREDYGCQRTKPLT